LQFGSEVDFHCFNSTERECRGQVYA
jgi:hypothetical protein